MKKTISLLALCLCLSFAASARFTYADAVSYVRDLGYNIGQSWSANLEQGQYFTKTFDFTAYTDYKVVAISDDGDVTDVDVAILTSFGSTLASDVDASEMAVVNFTPTFDRSLTIKVTNYHSDTPDYASKVYFFIAYK